MRPTRQGTMMLAAALAAVTLGGCSSSDEAGEVVLGTDEPVEGIVDLAPARLDAVGLGEPTTIEGDGCVSEVAVQPGGLADDGPRWLVTFTLTTTPEDEVQLASLLGDEACTELRRAELERIVAALGAIPADALDVTYVDASGARWLG